MSTLNCFKAYDVRGKLGTELDDNIAYRIGRAYAQHLKAGRVVVGGDNRLSSESLKKALSQGLMDAGADVVDIGMTGTEEVYFAAFHLDVDGGIQITASHNPIDYNGMKFVGRGAQPISGDSGLREIQEIAESEQFKASARQGSLTRKTIVKDYVEHILSYIDLEKITPLKLVVNSGNGAAGHVIDAIEARFNELNVPVEFIKVHHEADGNFPNGIPNPLLPEKRMATTEAVKSADANMGIAWDGDFDRCFFFDENGEFIEGYYIVGLLAEAFLRKYPGEKIIHDPRLTWNTIDIVTKAGGIPIESKTGHTYIKERMRSENAVYGGEMSAHHYFRDFGYCDSGMIPWLLGMELLCIRKQLLSELVKDRVMAFPCSGEVNYKVHDALVCIEKVKDFFMKRDEVKNINTTDGLSMEFPSWRFNLRFSNTEPLLRLNVEVCRENKDLESYMLEILKLINEK